MNIGTLAVIRSFNDKVEPHEGKMLEVIADSPATAPGSLTVNFQGEVRGIHPSRLVNLDEGFNFIDDWFPWNPFNHSFPEEPVDYETRRDSDGRGPSTA